MPQTATWGVCVLCWCLLPCTKPLCVVRCVCWRAESLEGRILEALTAVYPKPLNGAQLAKLCGHFKLKSKVRQALLPRTAYWL